MDWGDGMGRKKDASSPTGKKGEICLLAKEKGRKVHDVKTGKNQRSRVQ